MAEGGGRKLHQDAVAVVGNHVVILTSKSVGKDVVGGGGRDTRHACAWTT